MREKGRESCATLAVWGISRERIGQLFSECCLFSFFMYLSNTFVCWNCVWTFVLLGFYERRNVNVSLWKISFLHTLKCQWTRNKDLKSETYTIPFFFFFLTISKRMFSKINQFMYSLLCLHESIKNIPNYISHYIYPVEIVGIARSQWTFKFVIT